MKKLLFIALLFCLPAFGQVTVSPFVSSGQQFLDNSGKPLNGGKVCFFAAGSTTPQTAYSDNLGTVPLSNPAVLDSAGRANIFLTAQSYKIVIAASTANSQCVPALSTSDNISWATMANTVTSLVDTGALTVQASAAATSGANQSSPLLCVQGNYWTGAASASDKWCLQDLLGTGSNPTTTLNVTHGAGSSGTAAISLPMLTVTGASTLSSVTATSLDSILYAGGATYPCTSVGINAMLLATPSPSGAVHAEGCGSFTATTNIFAGVTGTGAIFMPCGVISTAVVQTVPTNWIVRGCGGEIATGAGLPTTGTVFKWTGGVAPATGVLNVFDTSHTNIYDIGIDCNSVASCVGINIDSDNTPISTFNSFTNILIMNGAVGMQVGTAGGAQQVSALDVTGLRCVSVTDCVVSNSSNALAGAHFRHMTASSGTNGFHFIKGTFTQIEDCTGGNLSGSMFLVEYTISLIIKNCQSEPTGNFLTVQTNDNYTTPITLIGNTINHPVSITQPASIISIGNHYTAIPTANNSALITSIGDKYDNGMEWALSGNSIINRLLANAVDGNPNQNYLTCGVGCNFTNLSNAVVASIGNTGAASFAGQVTSTLATGTAPLVIASTTPVANLTVQNCSTCVLTGTPTGTGIQTATLKTGTGAGNYTSASTTYVRVDSTNLAYTVTIPVGWKLMAHASGTALTTTSSVQFGLALADGSADNTGILVESKPQAVNATVGISFSLDYIIAGDGASHTINLQYFTTNGADSVVIANGTSTFKPTMTFLLTPSN